MINHYEQEPHAHFPNAVLDEFIVMPNHVHGIVFIVDNSSKSKRNTGSVGAENLQPFHSPQQIVRITQILVSQTIRAIYCPSPHQNNLLSPNKIPRH